MTKVTKKQYLSSEEIGLLHSPFSCIQDHYLPLIEMQQSIYTDKNNINCRLSRVTSRGNALSL